MQSAFFHTPYGVGIGGEAPPFSYKEYYKEYRKNQEMGEESAKIASQCRKFDRHCLRGC